MFESKYDPHGVDDWHVQINLQIYDLYEVKCNWTNWIFAYIEITLQPNRCRTISTVPK